MSPYIRTAGDQVIISLFDDETCPLSDKDLFKDYKKKRKTVDIHNSKFYLPNYDIDLIQKWMYSTHSYFEEDFLKSLDDYLDNNAVIIDIGANIGNHTLFWANEKNAKKIYAIEPVPYIFKILKKNIKINNLEDRVKLYNVGLADKKCQGEIKSFCKQNLGGTTLKVLQSNTQFTIPMRTLDSLNIKEEKIDLIKIDVEGMDYEVLKGAESTVKKHKPLILTESFPNSFDKSNAFLTELGYKLEKDLGSYEYLYIYNG